MKRRSTLSLRSPTIDSSKRPGIVGGHRIPSFERKEKQMPLVCGPKNSRYTYTGSPCPHTDLAHKVDALTLGDALAQYESHFGLRISAHVDAEDAEEKFGDKYFRYVDEGSGENQLVDIHVIRGECRTVPKTKS